MWSPASPIGLCPLVFYNKYLRIGNSSPWNMSQMKQDPYLWLNYLLKIEVIITKWESLERRPVPFSKPKAIHDFIVC